MRTALAITFLFLGAGCAHAKPKAPLKKAAVVKPAPPPVERVHEVELFLYWSAYHNFKAAEVEILRKYHIDVEAGEHFDPDTGIIERHSAAAKK